MIATERPSPQPAPVLSPDRVVQDGGRTVLTVARHRHGSGQVEVGGGAGVPVMVALREGYRLERRMGARVLRTSSAIGGVTIADPSERTVFTVQGQADVLRLLVPFSLTEAEEVGPLREVASMFNERDPVIERAALGVLSVLRRDDGQSALLLASIAYQLAARLARWTDTRDGSRRGGITAPALQRVRDLVEARLCEPFPRSPQLGELADVAGLSVHHFIKAFRQTTGETPHRWVLQQRIERARVLLTDPGATVGDVALRTGFSSPAHLVDAFRRRLGITPGAFRNAILL